MNVDCGLDEERALLTALHAVADNYCESCKLQNSPQLKIRTVCDFLSVPMLPLPKALQHWARLGPMCQNNIGPT